MEESPEEVRRREEKMQMYQACKEALNIIGECSVSFSSQSLNNEFYQPLKEKPSVGTKKSTFSLYFKTAQNPFVCSLQDVNSSSDCHKTGSSTTARYYRLNYL